MSAIINPANAGKKILLVASGMSPQILTETLYALIHQEPPFIPDEIRMVTTTLGKKGAIDNLLAEGDGQFYRFCRDYHFAECAFKSEYIHVIKDKEGNELADIVTKADNEDAADFITSLICQLTENDDSSLHVSLAGGRKTMSYFTGYALSLYGRPQDRLSHVLVDAGYEGLREFYYPTPVSHMLTDRNGNELDASKAQVSLADIPFIRLRDDLPGQLIKGKQSFRETIETMRLVEKPLQLDFGHHKECKVWCSGKEIKLPPVDYCFYNWIVEEQRKNNCGFVRRPYPDEPDQNYSASLQKILELVNKKPEPLDDGLSADYFKERVSRINKVLRGVLGKRVADPYILEVRGPRGSSLYGIDPAVFEEHE